MVSSSVLDCTVERLAFNDSSTAEAGDLALGLPGTSTRPAWNSGPIVGTDRSSPGVISPAVGLSSSFLEVLAPAHGRDNLDRGPIRPATRLRIQP